MRVAVWGRAGNDEVANSDIIVMVNVGLLGRRELFRDVFEKALNHFGPKYANENLMWFREDPDIYWYAFFWIRIQL